MALTQEQVLALANNKNDVSTPSGAITSAMLGNTAQPIQPTLPEPYQIPPPPAIDLTPQETASQQQYGDISSQIASLTGILGGQDAFRTGQQQQQDVIGKQQAVSSYQNQLKQLQSEAQAFELQQTNNQTGALEQGLKRGTSIGVIQSGLNAPSVANNNARLQNAIKSYQVGAQLSAAQGDLTSALSYVDQAVNAQFQPIEAQLKAQQANLQAIQNSPTYTSAQKKQAAQMEIALQDRADAIKAQRDNVQKTQDAVVSLLHSNPSIPEAARAALQQAQNPTDVAGIINYFGLTTLTEEQQLAQKNNERSFNQAQANADRTFNESQRQFNLQQKIREADAATNALKAATTATQKNAAAEAQRKATVPVLQDKINLIDKILSNQQGLSATVGPNAYSRIIDPYTSLFTSDKQDFIAGVNQLINQNTLDTLLNLKKQGGTLGALSEKEGAMLREAASTIGSWQLTTDGKVYGYDTTEKSFINELNTIKQLTQRALNEASNGTTVLPPEDTAQIDQLYSTDINPADFYK